MPLYGLAYGLYYNKKMFADAGLKPADDVGRAHRRGHEADQPRQGRLRHGDGGRQLHRERPLRLHLRQAERRQPVRRQRQADLHHRRDGQRRQAVRRPDGQQGGQPQQRAVQERPRGAGRLRQGQGRDADEPEQRRQHPAGRRHEAQRLRRRGRSRASPAGGKDVASFVAGINLVGLPEHQEQGRRAEAGEVPDQPRGAGDPGQAVHRPAGRSRAAPSTSPRTRRRPRPSPTSWPPRPSRCRWSRRSPPSRPTSATPSTACWPQAATGKAVSTADIKAALQEAQDKMAAAGS